MSAGRPYLCELLINELKDNFGEAVIALDKPDRWGISPGPRQGKITVMVASNREQPLVWIVDPNVREDVVVNLRIQNEDDVEMVIQCILYRLHQAAALAGDEYQQPERAVSTTGDEDGDGGGAHGRERDGRANGGKDSYSDHGQSM